MNENELESLKPLDFCSYIKVGEATCTVNLAQSIACWNPVSMATLGYSYDEVLGKKCWEILQGETENGNRYCRKGCPTLHQIFAGKPVKPFNLRVRAKDGNFILVNVSTVPLHSRMSDNAVVGIVHLMRPVDDSSTHNDYFRVRLLGSIEAQRPDGTVVEGRLWQRIKTRALLSYLAVHYGQPIPRDVLVDHLWSHMEYKTALRNLNTTIYNLRHSLEPDLKRGAESKYISYQSGNYRLISEAPFWLDVSVFEELVKQARQEKDDSEAVRLYEDARKLYRGVYLQDLYDTEQWQSVRQIWLRELYLTVLDELAAAYLRNGNVQDAHDIYVLIMEKDSCREYSCLQLIRLELAMGNHVLARHHCTQLRIAMRDELGVEIGDEIESMCQEFM